jgi:hypothetical protein
MVTESGERFQTLFDEKQLYKSLSVQEQENGVFIFNAELIQKKEQEKDTDEDLRRYHKNRLEGDLQLDGYILLGWYQGRLGQYHYNWENDEKYGFISERGRAAYLPKSGARWVYLYSTHARYAPHPDPIWGNKRWTHFAETDGKPMRIPLKKMLNLFSQTKPDSYKERYPQNAWILSVPLWLFDKEKDTRPLYLAGGNPGEEGEEI